MELRWFKTSWGNMMASYCTRKQNDIGSLSFWTERNWIVININWYRGFTGFLQPVNWTVGRLSTQRPRAFGVPKGSEALAGLATYGFSEWRNWLGQGSRPDKPWNKAYHQVSVQKCSALQTSRLLHLIMPNQSSFGCAGAVVVSHRNVMEAFENIALQDMLMV